MDAARAKFGVSPSPEEREKRQKNLVLPNILTLALSITMVVIGFQVTEDSFYRGEM
jgi:hypothetical protein